MGDRGDVVNRCPTMTQLVLAHDGALTPSERRMVCVHLDRCAPCRELSKQINAFIWAYGELLAEEPDEDTSRNRTNARGHGRPDFSPAAAERRFRSFRRTLHEYKQRQIPRTPVSLMRQWMPSAAAVLLCALVAAALFSRPQTVVLEAEELLKRVEQHERARPSSLVHRVQYRVTPDSTSARSRTGAVLGHGPLSIIRDVAHEASGDGTLDAAGRDADRHALPAPVTALLAAHRYDSRRWLDLDGYLAWRRSLPNRRDRVTPMRDGRVLLHTTTPHGALREAFLVVDRETHHVVQLGLVFEGIGRVDIEEIGQWVRTTPAPAVETRTASAAATVSMPVIQPPASPSAPRAHVPALAPMPRLGVWRENTFRSQETLEYRTKYADVLEQDTSTVRDRLHTLRRLAQGHSESRTQRLSASQRAALTRELDLTYRKLHADLVALGELLTVLQGRSPVAVALPLRSDDWRNAPPPSADWRQRVSEGASRADALTRQVQQLLALDEPPMDAENPASPEALRRTFYAIWESVYAGRQPPPSPE